MSEPNPQIARHARALMQRVAHGVLSTHSVEVEGYPFGSIVTFSTDAAGEAIVLLSDIAQHTHNIKANARLSLTLVEPSEDPQAAGRLTILADAEVIADPKADGIADRYLRRFPAAARYHETHDFAYYRLKTVKARYIGGFGRIHWVEAAELALANPFAGDQERGMCDHMNDDHADAMRDMCRMAGLAVRDTDTPRMAGIDPEGCEIGVGKKLLRFDFDTPAATPKDVRMAIVALARKARATEAPQAV
jgi:putative heme iron utilization protein